MKKKMPMLMTSMTRLGFSPYVPSGHRGYIITSFLYPDHPNFDFGEFYRLLNERDYVIYPGKVSQADCFRIGHIGRLQTRDIQDLLAAIEAVLQDMDIDVNSSNVKGK